MTTTTATSKVRGRVRGGRASEPRPAPGVVPITMPWSGAPRRAGAAASGARGRVARFRLVLREVAAVLLLGQLAS